MRCATAALQREAPSSADCHAPGCRRSWDLNKICYKSGVPLIENGMIERVSILICSLASWGGAFPKVGKGSARLREAKLGVGGAEGILSRSWRKEPRDRTDVAWAVPGR